MKNIFIVIFILSISFSCKKSDSNTIDRNERFELVPEPDKEERLKYEAIEALKKDTCKFLNPDISINKLFIRDYKSSDKIIGIDNIIDLNEQYHFYSKSKKEILTLNQHPGDGRNDISVFKVKKSDKTDWNFKVLNIETFESEKGIKLGVSKEFVKNKLGNCNKEILHSDNYIELLYRIEQPNDSETKILEKHSMPVYFATYKFLNDKLIEFEFGFEYP
jgi:hypothetical protein